METQWCGWRVGLKIFKKFFGLMPGPGCVRNVDETTKWRHLNEGSVL